MAQAEEERMSRFAKWRFRRRRARWHRKCDRLGIPGYVRVRMRKMDPEYRDAPDWYAGPSTLTEAQKRRGYYR